MSQTVPPPVSSFPKRLSRGLLAGAVLYLAVCLVCASYQRRLIYFPPVFAPEQAEAEGKSRNLERWNNAAGEPIGWKRLAPKQPAPGRVLIMHGNADCAFHCDHYVDVLQQSANLDAYAVEYPGYADRPGSPSEAALETVAAEAFQLLATNGPVYLVGESLGTGVAACLAGRHPDRVAGVVLLGAYDSLVRVGQAHMPFLPVWLVLRDRFPARDFLRGYHGPVAIVIGGQDTVVPGKFGRSLYADYAGPKKLCEFPLGTHDTILFQPPRFWNDIVEFWRANQAAARPGGQ
jgi:hypothetical protein